MKVKVTGMMLDRVMAANLVKVMAESMAVATAEVKAAPSVIGRVLSMATL